MPCHVGIAVAIGIGIHGAAEQQHRDQAQAIHQKSPSLRQRFSHRSRRMDAPVQMESITNWKHRTQSPRLIVLRSQGNNAVRIHAPFRRPGPQSQNLPF
jgi:hypothetical protein